MYEVRELHTDAEKKLYNWMCNEGAAQCREANESATGQWESAWAYMWEDGRCDAGIFPDMRVIQMLEEAVAYLPIRYV